MLSRVWDHRRHAIAPRARPPLSIPAGVPRRLTARGGSPPVSPVLDEVTEESTFTSRKAQRRGRKVTPPRFIWHWGSLRSPACSPPAAVGAVGTP